MALRTMNIEENLALTLARGCGRSLTALARLRPGGALQQPTWLAKGQDLLPAILAGAWDTSNSLDRAIVEQIGGGAPWGEIEKRIRGFQRDDDPPFDLEGTVWKVRAPMDAFVRIGPLIGLGDAELLRAAMVTVFSTIEAEADPNDIFLRPNPTGYSDWLREGLATTLLLLAVWSESAEVNLGGETGQAFANGVLNELPGLRTDARLWTSLRNELPLLAEAAPDPLLSALERMLEGDGSLIRPIFEEHHLPGWPFPETRHIGVLRALEALAWDPEHFRRAVLVLAGLAAIDPGRRQGNRPVQSLGEIFVLWNPNTSASSAERLSALDEIAAKYPDLGWMLIITLLPTLHGVSSPTAKPKLREAGAADRPPVTNKELWENQAAVSQRAITLAGRNPGRWINLIDPLTRFAPAERALAVAGLHDTLASIGEEERKPLWAKLRAEIDRHERFKNAPWALPAEELAPLRTLTEKYAPTDPYCKFSAVV